MSDTSCTVEQRITDYLASGGLFNPELANHDAVRDLLIDARSALSKGNAESERLAFMVRWLASERAPFVGTTPTVCGKCKRQWPSPQESWACYQFDLKPSCDRCGDTGLVTLKGVPNGIGFEMDADDQPCPECQK